MVAEEAYRCGAPNSYATTIYLTNLSSLRAVRPPPVKLISSENELQPLNLAVTEILRAKRQDTAVEMEGAICTRRMGNDNRTPWFIEMLLIL